MELNVSAIIDLSELKHPERITFVKRFLDSLINSPKELWHPCLVIIDEAHQFCSESTKCESSSAVIDLMTRGRKRGFVGILCTQRISKLNKDACAEANNYICGRTGLDIDMKRVSEILGFTNKGDMRSLRDLKEGEFYVFGSAFKHNEVTKIKVGEVQTTHQDRTKGINLKESSKTPENIKKLLKDVVDLQKESDEELRNTEDMKRVIRELKYKLTIAEKSQNIKEKIVNITDEEALQKAKEEGFKEAERFYKSYIIPIEQNSKILKNSIIKIIKDSENLLNSKAFSMVSDIQAPSPNKVNIKSNLKTEIRTLEKKQYIFPKKIEEQRFEQRFGNNQQLRAGAMKMLNWLAGYNPNPLKKQRLATLSGFSVKGGTFNTYISELKRNGWIEGNNEFYITQEGLNNSYPEKIPSGEELLILWKKKFREGCGKILQFIYESYPNTLTMEDIGINTGFESSGGTFNTYISELKRNGLIIIEGNNIKISGEFFE